MCGGRTSTYRPAIRGATRPSPACWPISPLTGSRTGRDSTTVRSEWRGSTCRHSPTTWAARSTRRRTCRSIYLDGWLCTAYEPSTGGQPTGLEKNPMIPKDQLEQFLTPIEIQYDGTEGALYNVHDDPLASPAESPTGDTNSESPGSGAQGYQRKSAVSELLAAVAILPSPTVRALRKRRSGCSRGFRACRCVRGRWSRRLLRGRGLRHRGP